jgi:hypothetical protein
MSTFECTCAGPWLQTKSRSKLCYDWRSVNQSALVSSIHLGPKTRFLLLSGSCRFVHVGRFLWREDRSVIYNCCWPSPVQSLSGPSPVGLMASNFFQLNTWHYSRYVTSSLMRGWVCRLQLLLALASAVILRSKSCRTHGHILLFQIWDSSNLEGKVPVFIYPRNRVAQLYPQALGSPSHHLLWLTGLQWRFWNPPSHGESQSHVITDDQLASLSWSQSQSYFMTGSLPPISSSWHQAPWGSQPEMFFHNCSHSLYVTSSPMRWWGCLLWIGFAFVKCMYHTYILFVTYLRCWPHRKHQFQLLFYCCTCVCFGRRLTAT